MTLEGGYFLHRVEESDRKPALFARESVEPGEKRQVVQVGETVVAVEVAPDDRFSRFKGEIPENAPVHAFLHHGENKISKVDINGEFILWPGVYLSIISVVDDNGLTRGAIFEHKDNSW